MARKKRFRLADLDFGFYLMAFSVLGFIAAIILAATKVDISDYVNSILFIMFGIALTVTGGIKFFFKYFENGLTSGEIRRLVTIAVGVISVITGVLIAPFFGIQSDVVDGLMIIIGSIAVMAIIGDYIGDRKK